MSQANEINGELFKLRREERGWAQSDMATRACMSVKQIRQIEEGGMSAFYSESVKVSATKKVAGLLGLSPEQIWIAPATANSVEARAFEPEHIEDAVQAPVEPKSEQHSVAQEPEPLSQGEAPDSTVAADVSQPVVQATTSMPDDEQAKPKTSLWLIAALFGAALAVAAYMRPDAEPVATEPPPPLQTVPSEAADPASSASAAVESASMPASAPMTASSAPAGSASKPAPAIAPASAAKPVLPATLTASVVAPARPASTVAAPVASAASK